MQLDIAGVQAKFARVDMLEMTGKTARDARALSHSPEDVVDVVQVLEPAISSSRRRRAGGRIRGSGTTPVTSRAMACSCSEVRRRGADRYRAGVVQGGLR